MMKLFFTTALALVVANPAASDASAAKDDGAELPSHTNDRLAADLVYVGADVAGVDASCNEIDVNANQARVAHEVSAHLLHAMQTFP